MQEYATDIFKTYIPSKSGIKKAIKKGLIKVDNKSGLTATWIKPNQKIILHRENKPEKQYKLKLQIVFEDDFIAIINKPAGILVSGNKFKTIANALAFNLIKSKQPDALAKPTPVHRLDTPTSGLLLIAKTKTAQISLGNQFKENTIKKTYHALVLGKPKSNKVIATPIGLKKAETYFEVLQTVSSVKNKALSLLKVIPKTGRTHQIRIHLSSIGFPIYGDKLYCPPENLKKHKGLFLAATSISLLHPKTLEKKYFNIAVPPKFTSLLKREKTYYNQNTSIN